MKDEKVQKKKISDQACPEQTRYTALGLQECSCSLSGWLKLEIAFSFVMHYNQIGCRYADLDNND